MIVNIISFNLLTPLQKLVGDVAAMDGVAGITIVDNASTYPPLLEWYRRCRCRVVRRANEGPTRAFRDIDKSGWHVVTDSDLDVGAVPKDACLRLRDVLERDHKLKKAGLSLDPDDIPATPLGDKMREWESKFWRDRYGADYWQADVATTFAVYRPGDAWVGYGPAVRSDRPYTARHTPWTWDPEHLTEEQQYYLSQKFVGTWWSIRLQENLRKRSQTGKT